MSLSQSQRRTLAANKTRHVGNLIEEHAGFLMYWTHPLAEIQYP